MVWSEIMPAGVEAMANGRDDATQVFKAIRRIIRAIDIRSHEVSRKVGLTIPQIVVLSCVMELGEVTTKQVSEAADLSAATVVTILDKLEAKGLIQRYRSAIDRRIVHARLTAEGVATLRSAPPLLHERFRAEFARLSLKERSGLISALEAIADMMDAREIDASPILTTTREAI